MTTARSWLYHDGMTIREVARQLRISPMRVRQLETRALEKIQQNPRLLRRLFEFVDFDTTTRPKEGPHR